MRALLLLTALALVTTPVLAQTPSATANYGEVSLSAGSSPHTVSIQAGGPVEVDVSGCGFGYVSSAPDYKVYYASGGGTLTIAAASGDDTTVLVNAPDGSWLCDDDSGDGTDPRLTIPNAAGGRYDVWVGTYRDTGTAPATLVISAGRSSGGVTPSPSTPPSSSGTPNPGAAATDGQVSLSAGFSPDPYTVAVGAGGPVDVDVSGCGFGYVSSAPDYKLSYSASGGGTLTVSATSGDDTTLLVNLPDGSWACDDDGGDGTNPSLTIPNAASGRYDIWVGTYRDMRTTVATLAISDSQSSAGGTAPPPSSSATSVSGSWATEADDYRGRNGARYLVTCPAGGTPSSRLWGSNPYTDDSSICTAGVHAGVISAARGGQVLIEIRPGQSRYASSTGQGLTSRSYGAWGGSFVVIR